MKSVSELVSDQSRPRIRSMCILRTNPRVLGGLHEHADSRLAGCRKAIGWDWGFFGEPSELQDPLPHLLLRREDLESPDIHLLEC